MKKIDAAHNQRSIQVPTTTGRVGQAMRKKIKADMLTKLQFIQSEQPKRKQKKE